MVVILRLPLVFSETCVPIASSDTPWNPLIPASLLCAPIFSHYSDTSFSPPLPQNGAMPQLLPSQALCHLGHPDVSIRSFPPPHDSCCGEYLIELV